jgi:hypothetical protein
LDGGEELALGGSVEPGDEDVRGDVLRGRAAAFGEEPESEEVLDGEGDGDGSDAGHGGAPMPRGKDRA